MAMDEPKNEYNGKVDRKEFSADTNVVETEALSKEKDEESSLFDGLMEAIGTNGKFQKRFNFMYNFVLVIVFTLPYLNIIQVMTIPEHWCFVPGRELANRSLDEWREKWLPREKNIKNGSFSSCKMYAENSTNNSIVDCQYGWEFDHQWFIETVVSQESWVCDKDTYVSNSFAAGRVGEVIGVFIFGQLGDKIGRKPVFYISLVFFIIGRTLTVFTSSYYYLFLFFMALGSLPSTSVFQSPLVISMEISDEKKRSFIALLQCVAWVAGLCILALLSWVLKEWKLIMLATTLPSLLGLLCYKMLPESPRWLASVGKVEEAVEVLKYIARVNNTRIPKNTYSVLEKIGNRKEKFNGFLTLFAHYRLAKNALILFACGTASSISYYVITLNVSNMSGNPFLSFMWQSLVELPGYILGKVLSDKLGRRWTTTGSYTCSSIFCITLLLLQTYKVTHFEILMVALVKLTLTISFYMVWLQSIEIYPTCVRQTGTSAGGVVANILGICGPYIVYLGTSVDPRIPYAILLVLIILGGIGSSFLPETLNRKLPETLDDAKVFGKDQKYWSFS